MNKRSPHHAYLVRVHKIIDLSPNLRRLVLHSAELAEYPHQFNGAHIKIFLARPGQTTPQLPQFSGHGFNWAEADNKPIVRTYTIRDYDAKACTISIDFVKHGDSGPACAFAEQAQPGDILGISSPGGPNPMLKTAARYLFAGDITALPAIESLLAGMQPDARGDVVLLLPQAEDLPATLSLPAGMRLHTFYGDLSQIPALVKLVSTFVPLVCDDFAWVAGEAALVKPLRELLRTQWQLPPQRHYAVPYWRQGENEESYHETRHKFIEK
ncbi:siderophore-interacting protein [Snodgrassella gandavensis]|uniref:siderophore-interacting protein n=1 Tax=Snodgrassella gandavensis TaxID=2946698 RepID=UPI001EF4EB1E|nr:siderophore-interacting protein [Snodgrassella gandavensis]